MIDKVLEFHIHDLYLEFAGEEIQALESSGQTSHILYDLGQVRLPSKFRREWERHNLKRIGIYESEVKSIKSNDLLHCSLVEVFQVYKCKNLEELNVEGMDGLRILDVVYCDKLGEKFQGVNKLKDLEWLHLNLENSQFFLGDLSSLTALQFLELSGTGRHLFHPPNLSGCNNLQELNIKCWESFPNLGNLTMLEKFECHECLKMESIIGLDSLTNLKVLDLFDCSSLVELSGLCNLSPLETLDVSFTNLSQLSGIGKLQNLQELDVTLCDSLTSLVELEYVTSLRRLQACDCYELRELPSLSNLKKLEIVDLEKSKISVIRGGFGRLANNCIFNLVSCINFFEPLVLWLWEQELLSMEALNDGIFPELPYTEDELRSNIREDVAYYMEQMSSHPPGLARTRNLLGEKEGGIEYAIKALCEHEDLGILSLVVAKYSSEIIAKTAIPKLSSCIIGFLNQQLNLSSSECGFSIDEMFGHSSFWRILFVLEHVIKNDMLVKSLEVDNIHLFIKKFMMEDEYSFERDNYQDDLYPVLGQWSLYLNQCCFEANCTCMECFFEEE